MKLLTCPKESQCQWVHTSYGLLPRSSLHRVLAHLSACQAQTVSNPAAPSHPPVHTRHAVRYMLSNCKILQTSSICDMLYGSPNSTHPR